MRGDSRMCARQAAGFGDISVEQPLGPFPSPAGCGERPEGKVWLGEVGTQGAESIPQQETRFPPLLTGANSRASACRGLSRLWVPPADHREEDEPGGSSKREEGPCCVPARGRGLRSSNHLQPSPRHIKLPPAPQLGHVPCREAKGQHVPRNHTRDDLQVPS